MGLACKSIHDYYDVGKALGKGTFGDVFKAQSKSAPSRVVALKTLRGTGSSSTSNECFENLREVIFFRNVVSHSNIIHLYDMFQDSESGNVVFALEYMRGNIFQLIEYHRKKNEDTGLDTLVVAKIIRDVLKGLDHIHQSGFVHRDIKPENILWLDHGRRLTVKLADFGLSRMSDPVLTRPWTSYVATRWYRSPEQLLDLQFHTTAVDIWAVSTILYEICNLAPLFPGKTNTDMIERHIEALGIPSRDAVGGASKSALKALEKLYGHGFNEEMRYLNGYVVTPEWFRWETHECFVDTMISGLQWDPNRRPSASGMLTMVRDAVHKYEKLWLTDRCNQQKRAKSM